MTNDEQIDILKKSGYKIIQNRKKFMFGLDAYLLCDFAEIRNDEKIVDFGTGTGIIPLLLADSRASQIFGLELQEESFLMAKKSVELNGLEGKIKIVHGDIKNAFNLFGKNFFNAVISNPPYIKVVSGKLNPEEAKNIARHEICCTLEDLFNSASKVLKSNGRFYMIHRPERLDEIFYFAEKSDFKIKRMRLVFPFADKNPTMVLVECRKNANLGVKVLPPLVVYEKPGVYTKEVLGIYERI